MHLAAGVSDWCIHMQNAKAIAGSWISGKCENAKASVAVVTITSADYTSIDGCSQGDSGSGNGSGDTSGATGEAVRIPA